MAMYIPTTEQWEKVKYINKALIDMKRHAHSKRTFEHANECIAFIKYWEPICKEYRVAQKGAWK